MHVPLVSASGCQYRRAAAMIAHRHSRFFSFFYMHVRQRYNQHYDTTWMQIVQTQLWYLLYLSILSVVPLKRNVSAMLYSYLPSDAAGNPAASCRTTYSCCQLGMVLHLAVACLNALMAAWYRQRGVNNWKSNGSGSFPRQTGI